MGQSNKDAADVGSIEISIDEWARLQDAIQAAGVDAIILPGGAHALLEQALTCAECPAGHPVFVCYRHHPELKPDPGSTDGVRIPHPYYPNGWSRPINGAYIRQWTSRVVVVVEG